jgi:hypothetical protein
MEYQQKENRDFKTPLVKLDLVQMSCPRLFLTLKRFCKKRQIA